MVPAHAEEPTAANTFTYSIQVPGDKIRTYSNNDGTLLVTNMKKSIAKVKFKLKTAVIDGERVSPSRVRISIDYTSAKGHTVSLTENKSSLVIGSTLLKSIAGTQTNPRISVRLKNDYASAQSKSFMPINDKKYHTAPSSTNFVNVNIGRYGTAKTNFEITRSDGFKVNGKKAKQYMWWISEYRPSENQTGTWYASDFMTVIDDEKSEAGTQAYHFTVDRKGNGNISGMTLAETLIRTGDSEETWESDKISMPKRWAIGKQFSYSYPLNTPKKLKASSARRGLISASWESIKNAKGYEIQCSRFKSFKQSRIQKLTGTATSANLYGLRSNNKYYVRVRARKTVDDTEYRSKWSAVKTVTVR